MTAAANILASLRDGSVTFNGRDVSACSFDKMNQPMNVLMIFSQSIKNYDSHYLKIAKSPSSQLNHLKITHGPILMRFHNKNRSN